MDNITVLIPVSPIPSHPSTEVLDITIESIKQRLPESRIILLFDGVSFQNLYNRDNYEKFITQCLHKYNTQVMPIVFSEHKHQTGMTRRALDIVNTPLILFVEQDTPLTGDIPFKEMSEVITSGYANMIRLHHEAAIHPEHKYLMLDEQPQDVMGVPLLRTKQWSQRPHLASTEFYKRICKQYWPDTPAFIEHAMYGPVVEGDFNKFMVHIYAPEGTLVRSLHTDGRRHGAEVYDPIPS